MIVLGLTGSIATGKSTLSTALSKYYPIIDLDLIAREIVEPGQPTLALLVKAFGNEILNQVGGLDRPKLGQLIFGDKEERKKLNAIMHPAIRTQLLLKLIQFWFKGFKIVVIDSPLLIETGQYKFVTVVLLIYCSEKIQLIRLMERNGFTEEEARERIASQMGIKEKLSYADFLVDNSGGKGELDYQVQSLVTKIQKTYISGWFNHALYLLNLIPPFTIFNAVLYIVYRNFIKRIGKKSNGGTRGERNVEMKKIRKNAGEGENEKNSIYH